MRTLRLLCSLSLLTLLPLQAQEPTFSERIDEAQTVRVTADAPAEISFNANTGRLSIEVYSDDFDPSVTLLGPDGALLAFADDDAHFEDGERVLTDASARLMNIRILESGPYTARIDSFNGVSEGEATLRIHQGQLSVPALADAEAMLTLFENEITTQAVAFEATMNYTIIARDSSGNVDPVLRIRDENGAIVAQNDDHGRFDLSLAPFDAALYDWSPPEEGTYRLEILDFLGRPGNIRIEIQTKPENP